MGKYLRDICISTTLSAYSKEHASLLALSTNFLEILYLDSLPKVATSGVVKVVVIPCSVLPAQPLMLSTRNPDVLHQSRLFDLDLYYKADKEARKRMALDFLQGGLLDVAKARGWDTKQFKEAYKTVLAKNFVNYRPWSKPITSPDRKHKAQAWCNYDSDKAEVFIVIFHRKGPKRGQVGLAPISRTVIRGNGG